MKEKDPNRAYDAGVSFWIGLIAGPLLPWIGYLAGLGISPADAGLCSISIFIAVLLHDLEGRVPLTDIRITPNLVMSFWAILNFGVVGGCLVSALTALAGLASRKHKRDRWLSSAVIGIFATAAAGAAFATILDLLRFAGLRVPENTLVPNEILVAGAAMLIAYQIVWAVGHGWLSGISAGFGLKPVSTPLRLLAGQLASAVAALTMFAAFAYFGTAFCLVVVPVTVFGYLAHRIHLLRLDQKTCEIADAGRLHLATVEALATAIDARDQVGSGHVRRTQIFAIGIGNALGLTDDELTALRAAALLHDIGKLAVPEYILNKPGRLTSAELEKTKTHANIGASILEQVGFPYPVVPTVKHHHERWDGSGYPDGLRGENIPITARILSVADTFDALRGPRPFRGVISREDACNYLRSQSGSQFDPRVVNAFLRDLGRLEAEIHIHGFDYESGGVGPEAAAGAQIDYVQQIKRANQEVFSLYEMARDFGASLNVEETLDLLTRKIKEFVPYDTCLVYLMEEGNNTAFAAHVEGRNSDVLRDKRVIVGEGATGYVLKKRKPVENVDPSLDFAFSHADICEHYLGMASVPLLADDRLVGAISLFSGKLAVYEEEHLRLLETISRISADAICKSLKHAETEAHAQTDPLTGLPNARGLNLQFEKEIGRARRSDSSLQLLMLDLDGFKAVNDTLGHKAGDTMLRDVGRIIRAELRDYDFLARYGGDEFVALVPETDGSDVIELASRIEAAVASYAASFDDAVSTVGVSIGAAGFPAQGESLESLLIAADKAMYRAKAFHKQRLVRLGEYSATARLHAQPGQELGDRIVDGPPELPPTPVVPGSDLVVELDESHIVVVNTVN
ncbi:MAG: diguanylate cyclase [Pyrinomonadaceae bacterium]